MQTILLQIGLMCLLSAAFALLLSLADKYIADYGEVKLTINHEKEYIVDGGNTLLDTLRNEKIFIPSACGGKGSCGYCKVTIEQGGGPVLATEKPMLTKEELESNVRLSCQCKVKQDIEIMIPEELFNVKEYETTLVEKLPLTETITKFRFELPEGEEIKFKPGQYVQLKAPTYEGSDEEVFRAYSVASSIRDEKHIELLIGYTGGICTTYCHKFLNEGDKVLINGPYGDFYYQEDDSDIIMVAAGTGFAPIRSILYHMRDNDIKRKARFYFGAKTPDDLFLLDELKQFEEDLYDFKFIPTLSRTTLEMKWEGDIGHVDIAINKYVVSAEDGGNYTAYLCGSPRMIESIIAALNKKGIINDRIFFDDFG